MKTTWFSFGQSHAHQCGKHLLNKDTILEITAEDPRAKMFELFGNKWSMQYDQPPDMRHFPGGIIRLDSTPQKFGMSDWERAARGLKDHP